METGPAPGTRGAFGPVDKRTPTGDFENCFEILTSYVSGGTVSWFCLGVGLVSAEYDHQGTPYGYRTVLIDYSLQSR